jgi:ATP-dependent DNA helicase RecQ
LQQELSNFVVQCEKAALEKFGFQKLHAPQKEALALIENNNFVLATLPTGAGKTLLYALPAALNPHGKYLVVCPLVALMRDQASRLQASGFKAAALHSQLSESEKKDIVASYLESKENSIQILLVSPERLQMNSFVMVLQKLVVSKTLEMIVVDEAHCVLNWGHSFRVEYGLLSEVFETLAPKKIIALTATLGLQNRQSLKDKIFPSKIKEKIVDYCLAPLPSHIQVKSVRSFSESERAEAFFDIIEKFYHSEDSILCPKIICYFNTRNSAFEFTNALKKKKYKSVLYHAGLSKEDRLNCETYVKNTKGSVLVCATMAFGMGIDIPDVGLVLVHGFPSNIEEFFQMIGRAGRNMQPAHGVLLWTGRDPLIRDYKFKSSYPNVASIQQTLTKLSLIIPRVGESKLYGQNKIKSLFSFVIQKSSKSTSESNEYRNEGMFAALRFLGVLEELPSDTKYDPYVVLNLKETLYGLVEKLPVGVTVRSIFFQAILKIYPKCKNLNQATLVLPLKILNEVSGLDFSKLISVLKYYAEQGDWEINFVESEKLYSKNQDEAFALEPHYILRGGAVKAEHLKNYQLLRQRFWEGLECLRDFAETKNCRMLTASNYFGVHIECGRCDYCVRGMSKKSKTWEHVKH